MWCHCYHCCLYGVVSLTPSLGPLRAPLTIAQFSPKPDGTNAPRPRGALILRRPPLPRQPQQPHQQRAGFSTPAPRPTEMELYSHPIIHCTLIMASSEWRGLLEKCVCAAFGARLPGRCQCLNVQTGSQGLRWGCSL